MIVGVYSLLAGLVSIFGFHRAWLLARFRWPDRGSPPEFDAERAPTVTVQIPLYNERTVAARVLRCVGALDYPRERLELQVLDDSNDATRELVEHEVAQLCRQGLDAVLVRRSERTGFKAGALANGLRSAKGELIAVFDADFAPRPDFLRQLVGAFSDRSIDCVQARWEHLNRDESAFTRAQAVLLDSHFVITHKVRFDRALFLHFNGTAGIWRRSAIERAGGWQHDTLTEDLDLSYRAQLAGSRLRYAAAVTAPAELPASLSAFRSQQARWARGTVQTARKLLPRIVAADLRPRVKLEATLHLLTHAGHPLLLALVALLPLTLEHAAHSSLGAWAVLLGLCTPAVMLFYERSQRAVGRPLLRRAVDCALAFVLGLGMSWALTRAALAGLRGPGGEFVRTPKRGDRSIAAYAPLQRELPLGEFALTAWCAFTVLLAVRAGAFGAAAFALLFLAGFAWVGALALAERRRAARALRPADTGALLPSP